MYKCIYHFKIYLINKLLINMARKSSIYKYTNRYNPPAPLECYLKYVGWKKKKIVHENSGISHMWSKFTPNNISQKR